MENHKEYNEINGKEYNEIKIDAKKKLGCEKN